MKINLKRLVCNGLFVVLVLGFCFATGGYLRGYSFGELMNMMQAVVAARCDRKTVEDRLVEIERNHPDLIRLAQNLEDGLSILVFKKERKVELWAKGLDTPCVYQMTGFSGELGPKLKEGDGQIPEGIYGVEYLNPNSLFHLSLKVSYPNDFDLEMAKKDGRTELGGDIMIHGGTATVGCMPVGDENIEEIFYLVAKAGLRNVKVVIAPYDMRKGRDRKLEKIGLPWYSRLCDAVEKELGCKF